MNTGDGCKTADRRGNSSQQTECHISRLLTYKQETEKWDTDSDSDETDDEDLEDLKQ